MAFHHVYNSFCRIPKLIQKRHFIALVGSAVQPMPEDPIKWKKVFNTIMYAFVDKLIPAKFVANSLVYCGTSRIKAGLPRLKKFSNVIDWIHEMAQVLINGTVSMQTVEIFLQRRICKYSSTRKDNNQERRTTARVYHKKPKKSNEKKKEEEQETEHDDQGKIFYIYTV